MEESKTLKTLSTLSTEWHNANLYHPALAPDPQATVAKWESVFNPDSESGGRIVQPEVDAYKFEKLLL